MRYKKGFILIGCTVLLTLLFAWLLLKKDDTAIEAVDNTSSLSGIERFPSSYQPYLQEILKKHPNWKFTPLYTNLDWNYVIEQENVFGKNLVPKNYSDSWKNQTPRTI